MKKLALAVVLASAFGSAQAASFYIDDLGQASNHNIVFANYDLTPGYSVGDWGALKTFGNTSVKYTLLGAESAYADNFVFGAGNKIFDSNAVGTSLVDYKPAAGLLNFYFEDLGKPGKLHNVQFHNGQQQGSTLGFAILKGYGEYQYLLGFNDSSKTDADYDDIVIGVSAVPLPAAALLFAPVLAGFGLMRRKEKAVA